MGGVIECGVESGVHMRTKAGTCKVTKQRGAALQYCSTRQRGWKKTNPSVVKKPHDEAPFSDELLTTITGVLRCLLDNALSKPGASLDGSGPSKRTDEAGPRAGESGWEDT